MVGNNGTKKIAVLSMFLLPSLYRYDSFSYNPNIGISRTKFYGMGLGNRYIFTLSV